MEHIKYVLINCLVLSVRLLVYSKVFEECKSICAFSNIQEPYMIQGSAVYIESDHHIVHLKLTQCSVSVIN